MAGMGSVCHVERDRIRFDILKLGDWTTYRINGRDEFKVDALWKSMIVNNHKPNLVISDTLTKKSDRDNLVALLTYLGYDVTLIRCWESLETCLERNALRGNFKVNEDVLISMWNKLNSEE